MTDSIIDSTRARLLKFKGRYPEICEKAGLSYSWLSKFARGDRGERPSFELISRLLNVLDELEQPHPCGANTNHHAAADTPSA